MQSKEIRVDNHVKFYRRLNNMTQIELAEMVGKTDKLISAIENGRGNPHIEICIQIAKIFQLDVSDIFFERGKAPEKRMVIINR